MAAPGVGSRILHYTILRAIGSGGMGRTAWLPGNAILLSARERAQGPYQFWTVQFPDGVTTRVTGDDVRGFGNISVSVTADGSAIVRPSMKAGIASGEWRPMAATRE